MTNATPASAKHSAIPDKRCFYNLCKSIEAQGNSVLNLSGSVCVFADLLDISVVESLVEIPDRSGEPAQSRKQLPFEASILKEPNVIRFFQTVQQPNPARIEFAVVGNGSASGELDRFDFVYWLKRAGGGAPDLVFSLYEAKFGERIRILDCVSVREEVYLVKAQVERLVTGFYQRWSKWRETGQSVELLAGWFPGFSRGVYEAIIEQSWDEKWYI